MKNKAMIILSTLVFIVSLSLLGCKKLVEVEAPSGSVNGENIFQDELTATSVINGLYANLSNQSLTDGSGIPGYTACFAGLLADELTLSPSFGQSGFANYYTNNLSPSGNDKPWGGSYTLVYRCNDAIEGLTKSTVISPQVRNQLLGDVYFLRALGYFYLTNLFGDVPLVTDTDYDSNVQRARTAQSEVYGQIVSDLQMAKNLLSVNYKAVDAKTNATSRITPNKAAASALLARVYLYMKNYTAAEAEATQVIAQNNLYGLPTLDGVFLSGSQEAIWQLQPVQLGWNTPDARVFVLGANGPDASHSVYLSPQLLGAFETGDQRRINWVAARTTGAGSWNYANKYKSATLNAPVTEYKMVLRLGEQFLIRAEARAFQNNLSGAQADINTIRNRAGLTGVLANTQTDLIDAIQHERQVELFTEWGDRWLNLKRTGKIDAVMSVVAAQKGGSWQTYKQLLPLPLLDLQRNTNLKQNPGY